MQKIKDGMIAPRICRLALNLKSVLFVRADAQSIGDDQSGCVLCKQVYSTIFGHLIMKAEISLL